MVNRYWTLDNAHVREYMADVSPEIKEHTVAVHELQKIGQWSIRINDIHILKNLTDHGAALRCTEVESKEL